MKTLGKVVRTAKVENNIWRQELYVFLKAYRNTPHTSTQRPPAEILLHRNVRAQLPQLQTEIPSHTDHTNRQAFNSQDQCAKSKMKKYADIRRHGNVQKFTVGDHVLVRKPRTDKFSSFYDPVPYQITRIKGPTITASRPGHLITKNVTFFKKISHSDTSPNDMGDDLITPPNRPPEPPPLRARRR